MTSPRALHHDFQWLRHPHPQRLFRTGADGLTLIGRESIGSWFEQSLVARRQQHLAFRAETVVDVMPGDYQHAAGLTTYYNRHKFHALLVTHEPGMGRVLTIQSCPGNWPDCALEHPLEAPVPLAEGPVDLRR